MEGGIKGVLSERREMKHILQADDCFFASVDMCVWLPECELSLEQIKSVVNRQFYVQPHPERVLQTMQHLRRTCRPLRVRSTFRCHIGAKFRGLAAEREKMIVKYYGVRYVK